jgi:hypothetical protein
MKLYGVSIIHFVYWIGCGLESWRIAVRVLFWMTDFSLFFYGRTDSCSCVASYPLGTDESFLGCEDRRWEDYHSPTSSVHVKNKWITIYIPPYLQILSSIYVLESPAQVEFRARRNSVFIHSFLVSYDRFIASSKTSSLLRTISCSLFQFPVSSRFLKVIR